MGLIIGLGFVAGLILVSAFAVDVSRKRHEAVHGETDVVFNEEQRTERDVIQAQAQARGNSFGAWGPGN
jgi:hypothetical protein